MVESENRVEFASPVVRIFSAHGKIQGAGFRISEKHVFTCAHVVAQVLGIAQDTKEIPLGALSLDFPLVAPAKKLIARVVCWKPDLLALSDIPIGERDIAVLELQSNAPGGSYPARLVTAHHYWGHTFGAFGFPQGHDEGAYASGVLRGRLANGWVQIEDVKQTGYFVAQGFSGTLVWDEQAGGVVGMIVGVEKRADYRVAFMIPAVTLAAAWPNLGEQIVEALPDPKPLPLEPPGASTDPQSPFYVARRSDLIALNIIDRQGTTTTIKGPAQMGKSTLLVHMTQAATSMGKRVALIDLQLFDQTALNNADIFFRQFCSWITDELDIEDHVEQYWTPYLGNIQRVTRYVRNYLLKQIVGPLVLAVKEVDKIFSTDFRKDFFGMLHSWHESRGSTPIWKRLDLVLVTSTEPYYFIDDTNQSPFVGEIIEPEDFTLTQAMDLNRRHGSPFKYDEVERLVQLVNGHPYLVRSALYQVACGQMNIATLFEQATADDGPFAQHLGHHYLNVYDKADLVKGLNQVIANNTCQDERVRIRLQGAGLVRVEGRTVKPRSPLYAEYFQRRLHV